MIKLLEIKDLEKDVPYLVFQNDAGKIAIVPLQKHIADYIANALSVLKMSSVNVQRNNDENSD
jgi:transcription antitermination factor NusA-like protein